MFYCICWLDDGGFLDVRAYGKEQLEGVLAAGFSNWKHVRPEQIGVVLHGVAHSGGSDCVIYTLRKSPEEYDGDRIERILAPKLFALGFEISISKTRLRFLDSWEGTWRKLTQEEKIHGLLSRRRRK